MAGPQLSVVIPVYDEASVLAATLEALVPRLAEHASTFEVVLVDDGSTDGSGAILAAAAADDPRLVHLSHEANRGKGAAVRTGVLAATGEVVVFMDADLSTPLDELTPFLAALEAGADVVIGNRKAAASRITRRQPFLREALGRGFTVLTRLLLAPGIEDFTCGFKAFRREAARAVFERVSLAGWAFDAEVIVAARTRGYRIDQLPVTWHDEDDTKVRVLGAVLTSLRDLIRVLYRRLAGRYRA